MRKLTAWLFIGALLAGIAGLAVVTETASTQELPPAESRFDLSCDQSQVPSADNGFVGVVDCTLTIDIPDEASPPLPDTLEASFSVTYNDNDQSGDPSAGDSIKDIQIDLPGLPTAP